MTAVMGVRAVSKQRRQKGSFNALALEGYMQLSKNKRKDPYFWTIYFDQSHWKYGQMVNVLAFRNKRQPFCVGCKGCIKTKETRGTFHCVGYTKPPYGLSTTRPRDINGEE
jgi:hypothetical protein